MSEQLISIIIPVYNAEKWLAGCLHSIKKQTYQNFEVIMVDDGSTDDSLRICDNYKEADGRFKCFHKENGGVSSARNCGLEIMQGEYVSFIDADDWVNENYLEELLTTARRLSAGIVLCNFNHITELGMSLQNCQLKENIKINIPNDYDYLMGTRYEVWGALFKKEIVDSIRFDTDLYLGEDSLFLAKAISKSEKIVTINNCLYNYIQHDSSLSMGKFDEKKFSQIEAYRRMLQIYPKESNAYKTLAVRHCLNCAYLLGQDIEKNYKKEILKDYRKYFKYYNRYYHRSFIKRAVKSIEYFFPKRW